MRGRNQIITVVLAWMCAARVATAHVDTQLNWHSATIGFGDPEEKNVLRIATNSARELTEFTVRWRGREFSVPASEFKSVRNVQLQSVRTQHSGGCGASPLARRISTSR